MSANRAFDFGEFTLDLGRGALLLRGEDVKLRPKSFEVLRYLVERHGQLVSKEELLDAIWSPAVVGDGSLTQCLIDVRRALGDDSQRMIRTVPRRGYIFDLAVTGPAPDAPGNLSVPVPARSPRLRLLVAAGFVVLAGATAGWWLFERQPGDGDARTEAAVAATPCIVVLPFLDMSPEHDQAYLAEGLSEELSHLLAQNSSLRVIARTSAFAIKGDIATVAAKLHVSHALEGSVRKAGNKLRVTVQLVDAATSLHIWSKAYERELKDVFDIQSDIAGAVAEALEVTLTERAQPHVSATGNALAYERFLEAGYFYNRRGAGDLERALERFQAAVDLDPGYARAWVGLAATYDLLMVGSYVAPEVAGPKEREAVEQALRLDPSLPEAHIRASRYYWRAGGDRREAWRQFEEARALDPDHPLVLGVLVSLALRSGRLDEAVELLRQNALRDPLNPSARTSVAGALYWAGRLDEAKEEFIAVLDLAPEFGTLDSRGVSARRDLADILILQQQFDEALELIQPWPQGPDRAESLAMVYHALGREAESRTALDSLLEQPDSGPAWRVAEVYAYRGENDEALAWLPPAEDLGTCWLFPFDSEVRFSPFLARLGDDPRWQALLATFNLSLDECVGARESSDSG